MKSSVELLSSRRALIEPLEHRIAPAILTDFGGASHGSALRLDADPGTAAPAGLSTGVNGSGSYLLFVEKGSALVFTTDLNANGQVDFNEITGIAAGDGLRLISFVDIHGDIVTNLKSDFTLTDSDNDSSNGRDGRVVLNNRIESIVLRSVTEADLNTAESASDRIALSTYSIFGTVYAGKGFGAADGGLTVDTTGKQLQQTKFSGATGVSQFVDATPNIGSIKVGTAVSGSVFSFGVAAAGLGLGKDGTNIRGELQAFTPPAGQGGADIIGVRSVDPAIKFNLGTLQAGDGGSGGRGGDVIGVRITGDQAGGYQIIAGDGAQGPVGGRGGLITDFADTGSLTSEVLLQAGNGGEGLLGAGGAGGTIQFAAGVTQNIHARVVAIAGSGGDGFTNGGTGGSQPTATITPIEGETPFSLSVVSTTRDAGDIFVTARTTHQLNGFDFDGDGYNDVVYSSADPDQLVVLFGSGDSTGLIGPVAGSFDVTKTIYLDAPANAEAFVVADFNGDGRPDIAAASADETMGGISTFLSRYEGTTFVGFGAAQYSALPGLTDPGFYQKATPVLSMAAGDFDDNGTMDIAIATTQTVRGNGNLVNTIMFLKNDLQPGGGTLGSGFFYADFETGSPITYFGGLGRPILKASALSDGPNPANPVNDVLLAAEEGAGAISILDYSTGLIIPRSVSLGKVDTNRDVGGDKISLADANLQDFTIIDADNDNDADIIVLLKDPAGFIVTLRGGPSPLPGADPNLSSSTVFATGSGTGDNSGLKVGGNGGIGLAGDQLVGILPANANGGPLPGADDPNNRANDIAIVDFSDANGFKTSFFTEVTLTFTATTTTGVVGSIYGTLGNHGGGLDESILAFDAYRPLGETNILAGTPSDGTHYNLGFPKIDFINGGSTLRTFGEAFQEFAPLVNVNVNGTGDIVSLANNGFLFSAGNGGDGLTGSGGAGGSVGASLKLIDGRPVGSFNVTLPENRAYAGTVRVTGGDGGQGFVNGGAGGRLVGISVDYVPTAGVLHSSVLILAGDGGGAITKTGGRGGDLSSLSIVSGEVFSAGSGGAGVTGGAGGSVIGNVIADVADINGNVSGGANVEDLFIVAIGGEGGDGIKRGGDGGSVSKFVARFLPLLGGSGGLLHYEGGAGGDAVSGVGGRGGSVVDSSPVADDNNLVGDILLRGGAGGRGTTGGSGGEIRNFINSSSEANPASLSVYGGNGGIGTAGNGGSGGAINNLVASAEGAGFEYVFDFSDDQNIESVADGAADFLLLNFSRVVAGAGGQSFGGKGGNGGNISSLAAGTTSTSLAVAAGAGGDGLRSGGNGGNVSSAVLFAAAGDSKLLIVAGDGGDAFAGNKSATKPLLFGGVAGNGGNGGSVSNVDQGSADALRIDVIAGNGGNTVNDGSSASLTSRVGNGGSITGFTNVGSFGNAEDPLVAIRSYNDVMNGQSMADFVAASLIANALNQVTFLDDDLGNVGLIVGAKGSVQDQDGDGVLDPSTAGLNGVLTGVSAKHIMSAVAGSVDRIAAIRVVNNVTVTVTGGIFGADKQVDSDPAPNDTSSDDGVLYSNQRDYMKADGTYTPTPVIGGRLVDGAIIGANQRTPQSIRDFVLG
jgi:hypothetical protein